MEVEMPRPVSRWQRGHGRIIRSERALLVIELPDEDLIQGQIDVQDQAPGRIRLNHVSMSSIVTAEGETSWRSVGRLGGPQRSSIGLDVRSGSQAPVGLNR